MNNLTKNYIERKEELEKRLNHPLHRGIKSYTKVAVDLSQKADILSVLEVIEKWGKENKKETLPVGMGHTLYGYNQALSDLLQFVSEAKDEIIKN